MLDARSCVVYDDAASMGDTVAKPIPVIYMALVGPNVCTAVNG